MKDNHKLLAIVLGGVAALMFLQSGGHVLTVGGGVKDQNWQAIVPALLALVTAWIGKRTDGVDDQPIKAPDTIAALAAILPEKGQLRIDCGKNWLDMDWKRTPKDAEPKS